MIGPTSISSHNLRGSSHCTKQIMCYKIARCHWTTYITLRGIKSDDGHLAINVLLLYYISWLKYKF